MRHRVLAGLLSLSAFATAMPQPKQLSIYGTFSSLRYIAEADDVVGYELTIVPEAGGSYAIFQCAEGGPTAPVFVKAETTSNTIDFTVKTSDETCNGRYHGRLTSRGISLRDEHDDLELLPRHKSYWAR